MFFWDPFLPREQKFLKSQYFQYFQYLLGRSPSVGPLLGIGIDPNHVFNIVNTVNSEESAAEIEVTKVPDVPKPPEPAFRGSDFRRKPVDAAPAGKVWIRGRLRNAPITDEEKAAKKARLKAERQEAMKKGHEALAQKRKAKAMVVKKIEEGIPVTPKEAALAAWRAGGTPAHGTGGRSSFEREQELLNKTASLIIKPANVHELRLKVEEVAKRLGYDPLESLIQMVQHEDINAEERISIHKTLLPFLVPTLPPIPKDAMEVDSKKVRVVVQQLHFAPEIKAGDDLFADRPKTVDVEVMEPDTSPDAP